MSVPADTEPDMPYNPQNRPNFLGFEADRTNPNRLTAGVSTVADQADNNIEPIPQPPTLIQQILNVAKIVVVGLAASAAAVVAAAAGGAPIAPPLLTVCTAIVAIATPLGLLSGGHSALQPAPKK